MKTAPKGSASIDSVFVGEVQADIISDPTRPTIMATYGLARSSDGHKFGKATRYHWSQQTLERFQALIDSMEEDVARDVFGDAAGSTHEPVEPTSDGVQGL